MRQKLFSIIASLTVLSGSVLPVQAQNTTNQPNSNLVNTIAQTIRKEFASDNWNEIKQDITFKYTEIDLNKDGTQETLVSIQQGFPCNNRHCPVYIYQKQGSNYRYLSSIYTVRNGLEVAVLPSSSKGWVNIATPVFTYEPREIAWRVFKYDGKGYQLTSQKLSLAPKQIVLRETHNAVFNFVNSKGNYKTSSYIGLTYKNLPQSIQYLGGWVVGDTFNGREYVVSHLKKGTQEILWFEIIQSRDSQGQPIRQVIDTMNLPKKAASEQMSGNMCKRNGVRNSEIIVFVKNENAPYLSKIARAWRSNRQSGRFEAISTRGIVCENPGWGV